MDTNKQIQDITDVMPDKKNTKLMTSAASFLLLTGLWPAEIYNSKTGQSVNLFIKQFIEQADDPYKAYAEFCQRVLMARHYMIQHPDYVLTQSVTRWLDPENAHGLEGTADWFGRLQQSRINDPLHLLELKAFPEALLELAEEPTAEIFHYWATWFLERKAYDEYLMLILAGIQLVFKAGNGIL